MRIISKFQDFYDSALAFGHDTSLTYVRHTKDEIKLSTADAKMFGRVLNSCPEFVHCTHYTRDPRPFIIGFCGQFIMGARINVSEHYNLGVQQYKAFYNVTDIEKHFSTIVNRSEREDEVAHFVTKRVSWFSTSKKPRSRREEFDDFFDWVFPDSDDMFFDFETPIFVIERESRHDDVLVTKNPCLKDYGFAKAFDPYTAFQEIEMYLGGVLGLNEPDMVTISDVHMRDKKGFNDMSFKKLPTKRR